MSKTVKGMIIREYKSRLQGMDDATLISIRGISSNDTNKIRGTLRKKNIRVTMVQNALARKAFEGTGLEGLGPIMKGANALAYGGASVVEVARELVKLLAEFPLIEMKGAILDGQLFEGEKGVKELSKYPTREEGLAKVITLLVSPGRTLMGQVKGPGAKVAGIIKAIEERLEKGQAIAKAG
jgi:large subunit ribosomal protein L10